MADLRHKVKLALDEARMLVLGCQVLVGFQLRSFFERRFDELPSAAQNLQFGSLLLLIGALLLLILPAAYHRIVEQGEDTQAQHRFTSAVMDFALLPFAVVIGADIYLAALGVQSHAVAVASGAAAAIITLFLWYGLEWIIRARNNGGKARKKMTIQRARR